MGSREVGHRASLRMRRIPHARARMLLNFFSSRCIFLLTPIRDRVIFVLFLFGEHSRGASHWFFENQIGVENGTQSQMR